MMPTMNLSILEWLQSSEKSEIRASAPIPGCHFMIRAAYVLPTFTVSIIMRN